MRTNGNAWPIAQVLSGANWQRGRVHFMRNLLAHVPHGDQAMVAAALRPIYAQPNQEPARGQLRAVYDAMQPRWPNAAEVLIRADDDLLAYRVFPDEASVDHLVGAILLEQDDEWEIARRYFSLESMRRVYAPQPLITVEVIPFPLAPED